MPVHRVYTPEQVMASIRARYKAKRSFRRVAREDYGGRVSHATIARIVAGIEPRKREIRIVVGLPVDPIPQAEMRVCACGCAQAFYPATWNQARIHGHPRRR